MIKKVLLTLLVIILTALTGVSVYFWQNSEKEKEVGKLKLQLASYKSSTTTPPVSTPAKVDEKKKAVVVLTPNGLFNEDETAEIKKKFVMPFEDWNNENSFSTVSIMVEKPFPALKDYKYKVTYIYDNGGEGGFLYGTTEPLEWWLPGCLGPCNLSDWFKTKYPEILKELGQ